jgi:hypothetical protein
MSRSHDGRTPGKAAHRHDEEVPESSVPVVLPHVVMTVAADGTMTVTVDGAPHLPEPFAPRWRREDFAAILDQLTDQRRSAVRVEVIEADGTRFTDIITPGKRRRADPVPDPDADVHTPAGPPLLGLHESGFVPGEDVAVAIVAGHADAASDGTVRILLTPDQLASSPTGEVILLGRVSGTLAVGHPE